MKKVTNKAVKNQKLCIFCNEKKQSEECKPATDAGFSSFRESAKNRLFTIDSKYGAFLNQYLNLCRDNVQYHRKCYSNFTNKTLISRLPRRNLTVDSEPEQRDIADFTNQTLISMLQGCNANVGDVFQQSKSVTTSSTDWSLCVICQDEKKGTDHLRKFSGDTASKIETFAEVDNSVFMRIKDIDLIVAQVQHHGLCLIDLERRYKKKITHVQKKPSAFNDLCAELRASVDAKVIKIAKLTEEMQLNCFLITIEI